MIQIFIEKIFILPPAKEVQEAAYLLTLVDKISLNYVHTRSNC